MTEPNTPEQTLSNIQSATENTICVTQESTGVNFQRQSHFILKKGLSQNGVP